MELTEQEPEADPARQNASEATLPEIVPGMFQFNCSCIVYSWNLDLQSS